MKKKITTITLLIFILCIGVHFLMKKGRDFEDLNIVPNKNSIKSITYELSLDAGEQEEIRGGIPESQWDGFLNLFKNSILNEKGQYIKYAKFGLIYIDTKDNNTIKIYVFDHLKTTLVHSEKRMPVLIRKKHYKVAKIKDFNKFFSNLNPKKSNEENSGDGVPPPQI